MRETRTSNAILVKEYPQMLVLQTSGLSHDTNIRIGPPVVGTYRVRGRGMTTTTIFIQIATTLADGPTLLVQFADRPR